MERANIPRSDSVRVFLNGLFDYAGLYPPASLPLKQAVAEYAAYCKGADQWMLGPFVCAVPHLDELENFENIFNTDSPFRLSVLGTTGTDHVALLSNLSDDALRIRRFATRHGDLVSVEMMEIRLPAGAAESPDTFERRVHGIAQALAPVTSFVKTVFLEIVRDDEFASSIGNAVSVLQRFQSHGLQFALKLRCGGMQTSDYPQSDQIAAFLDHVVRSGVPFKATAGLHHPVRTWHEHAGVKVHGFLNVFFAAALHRVHHLDQQTLRMLIDEVDAAAFIFSASGIAWRDYSATTDELRHVRNTLASSIGSCSFDEPREDLLELNWLSAGQIEKR